MMRLFTVALAVALLSPAAVAAPTVGQPAPEFTAVDSNGASHSLADFKGKIVVLEWTNAECPYTRKHYDSGNMQKLQEDATHAGVVWLSIISSAPGKQGYVTGAEANQLTISRKAHPSAVLLDPAGAIGREYEARTTPQMFVIDRAGVLRYMGAIDDKPVASPASLAGARNYVRAALASVEAGKPVAVASTEPYGCSVKY
ncbi:MAG: redoxin domain-containing protein [Alphaproteobacteria bacterium]|nr:redoxin domain-containing protein [Alphaproteobacteria bacterium]